jgi:hypothetical protein
MDELAVQLLRDHLNINEVKPVSYLPSRTITNFLGMCLEDYKRVAREKGLCCLTFDESESCINSDAVYVFDRDHLENLLSTHANILQKHAWPSDAAGFIRRIARDWLADEDPILPLVRRAFGDLQ